MMLSYRFWVVNDPNFYDISLSNLFFPLLLSSLTGGCLLSPAPVTAVPLGQSTDFDELRT